MDELIRPGRASDIDACVRLWVDAVIARDGAAPDGTAERARSKFEHDWVAFVVAREDGDRAPGAPAVVDGFALVTAPGAGLPSDPPDAAYLGMIATAPDRRNAGLGSALLARATAAAFAAGYPALVLHVLLTNTVAVGFYERRGWLPAGPDGVHALSGSPTRTLVLRRQ